MLSSEMDRRKPVKKSKGTPSPGSDAPKKLLYFDMNWFESRTLRLQETQRSFSFDLFWDSLRWIVCWMQLVSW